jgi:hypothetical protein
MNTSSQPTAVRATSPICPFHQILVQTLLVPVAPAQVPRDLRQLPKVLPPPSYDSDVVAPLKPAPAMASAAAAAVVPGPRPPSQPHPLQPSSAGNGG